MDGETVSKAWRIEELSEADVAAVNQEAMGEVAVRMMDLATEGQWELGSLRIHALQCQIIDLIAKAVQGANLQTNLTAGERARFVEIRDSLAAVVQLWNAAKSHRDNIRAAKSVVDVSALDWPTNRVVAK
jgi:hypothetical protein